jgi:hypothetical protein
MRVYQYWAGSKICCFSSILKNIFVLDVVKPTESKEHRNKSQLTSTQIPVGIEPKVWVVTSCCINASQPDLLFVKVLKLRIFGCKGYFCGKAPRASILVNSKATKWLAGEKLYIDCFSTSQWMDINGSIWDFVFSRATLAVQGWMISSWKNDKPKVLSVYEVFVRHITVGFYPSACWSLLLPLRISLGSGTVILNGYVW